MNLLDINHVIRVYKSHHFTGDAQWRIDKAQNAFWGVALRPDEAQIESEFAPCRRKRISPDCLLRQAASVDRVIIDATERAYLRSQDDATQREYYSGKKKSIP